MSLEELCDASLPQRLRTRLAQPLPGIASCQELAPELCYGRHAGPAAHDVRQAAVLILLYRERENWRIPLITRPHTMSTHAGQVSFPGGELEPGETIEAAALRECCEELGACGHDVEVLGRLSQVYVFASNYLVTPCVAATQVRPDFHPNEAEVANLLEPTLVDLLNPARRGQHIIDRRGLRFHAPHIELGETRIWGATSLMLEELAKVTGGRSHRPGDQM